MRILCISLGSIGRRHLRNCRELLPNSTICVFRHQLIVDAVPPEGADEIVFDIESALKFRPDAVIVSAPANKHVEYSKPFIEAGCSVFIEKPLETAVSKLEGFVDCVRNASGFVMVGYVLRFLPALLEVRKQIAEGLIGQVRTAFVQTGQYLPDWRPDGDYRKDVSANAETGGGVLLELSHELDYACWLFGPPKSLLCSTGQVSDLEIDVEDSAHVIFEYSDKRVAIQVDFLQRCAKMGLQIIGSEATIEADLIKEEVSIFKPGNPEGVKLDWPRSEHGNEIYLRQFDTFFAKSFGNYTPRFSGSANNQDWASVEQATDVIKIVEAAKESSKKGSRVYL